METYRLVINSQEAFFVLPTGEKFLYAITKGKIFLPHSDIVGVFQHLSATVAGSANELPLKLISDMGSVEKLSADYKGSVISFTTTLSIDEIKDAIEVFFAYRIPPRQTALAPEVRQSDKVVASICHQSSPISIVSGQISLPCSEIAGAFNRLLEAMIEYSPNEYGELSPGNYEKISAGFKKGIISFTTTLSIDVVDDTLKYAFSPLEPVRPSQSAPDGLDTSPKKWV